MNVEPLTPYLGAVISGLDLREPIAEVDRRAILELFRSKHLLLFKDKILTPDQQVRFSEMFGTLEKFPYNATQIRGRPEIFRLSNIEDDGYENVGFYWHQDGSFLQEPTATSIFHMIKVPQAGGATLFTSMCAAYDSLADVTKARIDGLKTLHRNGVVHPLVFSHPYTGRKSIYLNLGLTAGVIGLKASEGQALLEELNAHLSRPQCVYSHTWREGDLIVADNYGVAHQATYADPKYPRTLHRTTIKGELKI
jgi:taurine dioxygenase